jgi:hypothetical protein
MVAPRVFLALLSMFMLLLAASDVSAENVDVSGDLTSTLDVAADGSYDFSLLGDEGGTRVFIDGALVIDGSAESGSIPLTQGLHTIEIQFDECCGGIQLVLPAQVTMQPVPVPEPHPLLLLGAGLAMLAVAARMRTRANAARVEQAVHRR